MPRMTYLPQFTAEASLYRSTKHYCSSSSGYDGKSSDATPAIKAVARLIALSNRPLETFLRVTGIELGGTTLRSDLSQVFTGQALAIVPQSSTVDPENYAIGYPTFGLAFGGPTSPSCQNCLNSSTECWTGAIASCIFSFGIGCVTGALACTNCWAVGADCCKEACGPDGGGCCDDDAVCCGGGCCYTSSAFGKTAGVCSNATCCLPGSPVGCGDHCCDVGQSCCAMGCCPDGLYCVDDSICCTNPNMINCGGSCCSSSSDCINNDTLCCESGITCGNQCCAPGEVCNPRTGLCDYCEPCGSDCCGFADGPCCDGQCCAVDQVCLNGASCCPKSRACSDRLDKRKTVCCPSGSACVNGRCMTSCPDGEDISVAPDGTATCCPLYQCDNPSNDNVCVQNSCPGGVCCADNQVCCPSDVPGQYSCSDAPCGGIIQ